MRRRRLNTGPLTPVENWVRVDRAGWRRVVLSAAGYDNALSEASEGGQAVGAALDDLDLVDDAFGVAVAGRLVEVGEQFLAPLPDAVSERGERRDLRTLDGRQEAVETLLGRLPVGGSVDRPEGLLESPRLV